MKGLEFEINFSPEENLNKQNQLIVIQPNKHNLRIFLFCLALDCFEVFRNLSKVLDLLDSIQEASP